MPNQTSSSGTSPCNLEGRRAPTAINTALCCGQDAPMQPLGDINMLVQRCHIVPFRPVSQHRVSSRIAVRAVPRIVALSREDDRNESWNIRNLSVAAAAALMLMVRLVCQPACSRRPPVFNNFPVEGKGKTPLRQTSLNGVWSRRLTI